jgi:hypothetical protein
MTVASAPLRRVVFGDRSRVEPAPINRKDRGNRMKTMDRPAAGVLTTRNVQGARGARGALAPARARGALAPAILALLVVLAAALLTFAPRESIGSSGASVDVDQALVEFRRNERQEKYGFSAAEVSQALVEFRRGEREER